MVDVLIILFLVIVFLMAASFIKSCYHFVVMMSHGKQGGQLKISLFAPISIFYSGFWTDKGNEHREAFLKYLLVSLIGGVLLFLGKVLLEIFVPGK